MASKRALRFLAAQSFQLLESCGLSNIFPEDGDVDVFGEPFDQAVAFGERGFRL